MKSDRFRKFRDIGYNDFRRMATDQSLSGNEKAGFPDDYRAGKESAILADMVAKVPRLGEDGGIIVDIGPGCSPLALSIIAHCENKGQHLLLVDSGEVLSQLPDIRNGQKIAGFFPDCKAALKAYAGRVDCVICYSVFHYLFAETNVWAAFDASLELLTHGGALLLGDIPNMSKRKRFFSSPKGAAFHRAFMETDEDPHVTFNVPEPDVIDDSVVLAFLMRARLHGFDSYLLPQPESLPMGNRREDVLIIRP